MGPGKGKAVVEQSLESDGSVPAGCGILSIIYKMDRGGGQRGNRQLCMARAVMRAQHHGSLAWGIGGGGEMSKLGSKKDEGPAR